MNDRAKGGRMTRPAGEQKAPIGAVLRESETKYRRLYESMADAFVVVDMQGGIQEFNPAYEAMLGYSKEELGALTYTDLTPEKWHAMEARIVAEQIIPHGSSGVYEKEYRRKDGTVFPVELRTILMRDGAGRPAAMWAIIRDVSARKHLEQALQKTHDELEARVLERTSQLQASEEQFRTMFETVAIGIGQADPQTGRFLRVNKKMCAITGYSMDELLKLHVSDITHPDDRATDWDLFQRVIRGEQPDYQIEKRYVRKDGALAWVRVNMTVIRDDAGKVLRTMATIEDVTERKKTEQRIVQLSRVQAVLGGVNHAIAHIPERQKLLEEICRVTVDKGAFKLAWAGMVAPDGSVRCVAAAGATDYLDGIRVVVDSSDPHGLGPVGTCIRENRPVVIEDVTKDQRMRPWQERARRFGLLYVASFPIRVEQRAAGAFAVYAPKPDFFDDAEIKLLTQISDDISFALTAINHNEERRRAEEQLHLGDAALAAAANAIAIVHRDGAIIWINRAFTAMTGYTLAEARGQNPRLLKSGMQDATFYRELWETVLAGQVWRGELVNRRKDGSHYSEEMSITPVKDGGGQITHFVAIKQDISQRKRMEMETATAIEREQERIGRDLHDGLCQILTGAKFRTALLGQKMLGWSPLADAGEATAIESLLEKAIEQARGVAQGLNPVSPVPDGLMVALQDLAAGVTTETGPQCACYIPRPVRFTDGSTAIHLYRIAQEAVQNALKHSGAKHISIELTRRAGTVTLAVADDGTGIGTSMAAANGSGLMNMKRRAELAGGTLRIRPAGEKKGTIVSCRIQRPGRVEEQGK
jgi:PAS domain S-box-containing protein